MLFFFLCLLCEQKCIWVDCHLLGVPVEYGEAVLDNLLTRGARQLGVINLGTIANNWNMFDPQMIVHDSGDWLCHWSILSIMSE